MRLRIAFFSQVQIGSGRVIVTSYKLALGAICRQALNLTPISVGFPKTANAP